MEITWYGTAAIKIHNSHGSILFDPFVPLSGSDISTVLSDYDGATDIFVTHGHFDHITHLPSVVLRNPDANIYCTKTPYQTLRKKGIPERNLVSICYGSEINISGFHIHAYHGKHAALPLPTISRLTYMLQSKNRRNLPFIMKEHLRCQENDETLFYQIECDGKQLSLMGSLNLRNDVVYPTGSDLLILPYNGWADNYPPAVRVIQRLNPKKILLDHYDDTFPPVTIPLNLNPILEQYPDKIRPLALNKVEYL